MECFGICLYISPVVCVRECDCLNIHMSLYAHVYVTAFISIYRFSIDFYLIQLALKNAADRLAEKARKKLGLDSRKSKQQQLAFEPESDEIDRVSTRSRSGRVTRRIESVAHGSSSWSGDEPKSLDTAPPQSMEEVETRSIESLREVIIFTRCTAT